MGIKNFSKVFNHNGEVKYKDMRNKVVAVDAMYQLHRTAHQLIIYVVIIDH